MRSGASFHRQADHHQIGLDLAQILIGQAPLFHDMRGKVLRHHIGLGNQPTG